MTTQGHFQPCEDIANTLMKDFVKACETFPNADPMHIDFFQWMCSLKRRKRDFVVHEALVAFVADMRFWASNPRTYKKNKYRFYKDFVARFHFVEGKDYILGSLKKREGLPFIENIERASPILAVETSDELKNGLLEETCYFFSQESLMYACSKSSSPLALGIRFITCGVSTFMLHGSNFGIATQCSSCRNEKKSPRLEILDEKSLKRKREVFALEMKRLKIYTDDLARKSQLLSHARAVIDKNQAIDAMMSDEGEYDLSIELNEEEFPIIDIIGVLFTGRSIPVNRCHDFMVHLTECHKRDFKVTPLQTWGILDGVAISTPEISNYRLNWVVDLFMEFFYPKKKVLLPEK